METIETTKKIKAGGTSLCVYLTKELKELGLKEGDLVKIILQRP